MLPLFWIRLWFAFASVMKGAIEQEKMIDHATAIKQHCWTMVQEEEEEHGSVQSRVLTL
jgi:hypothetical protein